MGRLTEGVVSVRARLIPIEPRTQDCPAFFGDLSNANRHANKCGTSTAEVAVRIELSQQIMHINGIPYAT